MQRLVRIFQNFIRKGDLVLLFLCLLTTGYGCVIISSTTRHMGSARSLTVQIAATIIGVIFYILLTNFSVDALSERRELLFILEVGLILLLIPFGTDNGTGNRSWLDLPLLPINIQPAEVCKLVFTILLARVMESNKNNVSSFRSIIAMALQLLIVVGLNMRISKDAGVSLIFVFVFIIMAFVGGVKLWWFLAGFGAIAVAAPIAWTRVMAGYQKERIMVLFDPTIDPQGLGVRWHLKHSLMSLTGGGLSGQGLYHGARTQAGALFAQHTDFVFSAIGEELGLLGCLFTLLLLAAIVARVIFVGLRSNDYMSRLVCVGVAAALIFQIFINVGMCIGLAPVIGLTLPFISYGGSSIVSMYLAMAVVSSVYAHPGGAEQGRYVRLKY